MNDLRVAIESLSAINAFGLVGLSLILLFFMVRQGSGNQRASNQFQQAQLGQQNRLIEINQKSDERLDLMRQAFEKWDERHKEDFKIVNETLRQQALTSKTMAELLTLIHEDAKSHSSTSASRIGTLVQQHQQQYEMTMEQVRGLSMSGKEQLDLLKAMDAKLEEIKVLVSQKPDLQPVLAAIEELHHLIANNMQQVTPPSTTVNIQGVTPQ